MTGEPRTIEIWYAAQAGTVYLLSGGGRRAHWVRNLIADPRVQVQVRRTTWTGRARLVRKKEEDARARRLLAARYEEWQPGRRLSDWARTSLPVAIDILE